MCQFIINQIVLRKHAFHTVYSHIEFKHTIPNIIDDIYPLHTHHVLLLCPPNPRIHLPVSARIWIFVAITIHY